MKRMTAIIFGLLLSLSLSGNAWPQAIMHPDEETLRKWNDDYENTPKIFLDEVIHHRLTKAQALGVGTSTNLLAYLKYIPDDRDQGSCGDCWVWASTGILEIALNVQNGIKDRLSVQYLNSCKTGKYACCGGWISEFATWYAGKGFIVPWANSKASFEDDGRKCSDGSSLVSCGSIPTTSDYPITYIQPVAISTYGVGQATAIDNIKNVLHQNKAVFYSFFMSTKADWDGFNSFWWNQTESALWSPDSSCGETWVNKEGAGHAVMIVGYNDEDASPANHYWIILNSWGTANGKRPNGLFRMPMYINYDCTYHHPSETKPYLSNQFLTLNVTFNPSSPPAQMPNLTPYQPQGWSNKVVVSNATATNTDSSSLNPWDTLYVGFAVLNDSDVAINAPFSVDLYVDEVWTDSWTWDSLKAHYYGYVTDYSIGSLGPGTHTFKIVVDSTGAVDESNERDNEYVKTITVNDSPAPDLTGQWTSLVPSCKSSRRGQSCKISGSLQVMNIGELDSGSFYADIFLSDDTEDLWLQSLSVRSLKAGSNRTLRVNTNLPSNVTLTGKYIVVIIDPDNYVDEFNKDNNILINGPIP